MANPTYGASTFPYFGNNTMQPKIGAFGSSSCGSFDQTPAFGSPFGSKAGFLEPKTTASPFESTTTSLQFGAMNYLAATATPNFAHSTSNLPNFGHNTVQLPPAQQGLTSVSNTIAAFGSSNCGSIGQTPAFGSPFGSRASFPESKTTAPPYGSTTTSPSVGGFRDADCCTQPSTRPCSSAWISSTHPGVQPTAYSQGPNSFGSCPSRLQATIQALGTPPSFGPSFPFGVSTTPGFQEAKTPAFGVTPPSSPSCFGWRPPSSFGLATTSVSDFGGCGAAVRVNNLQGGSRLAPYCETQRTEGKFMLVSAMNMYRDMSHEELRWEDCKNFKNKGNLSSIPLTESDGHKGCNCKSNQLNATPIGLATGGTQSTNACANTFVNYNHQPFAAFSVPAFFTFIHPATPAVPAQHFGLTVAPYAHPFGIQISPVTVQFGGLSTNFVGFDGLDGACSTFPVSFASPVVGLHGGLNTCFVDARGPNGASSVSSSSSTSPNIGSVGGLSTGCIGPPSNTIPLMAKLDAKASASVINPISGTAEGPSTSCVGSGPSMSFSIPAPFSCSSASCNSSSIAPLIGSLSDWRFASPSPSPCAAKVKEADKSDHVPKGLEIIVEKLGFNPWSSQGKVADAKLDCEGGGILPCEEASKDEDIIALAEFAVEQHNALHKDDQVILLDVVAACLEAVGGGRYHIVLNTRVAGSHGFIATKKHYAVVLRKSTDRPNHLTVLEKWLPSKA